LRESALAGQDFTEVFYLAPALHVTLITTLLSAAALGLCYLHLHGLEGGPNLGGSSGAWLKNWFWWAWFRKRW
jgi:hypothetical protein